jgi:pimeloyl-ACP methyl ester carboxylesterase
MITAAPWMLLPGHMCDARVWDRVRPHLQGAGVTCRVPDYGEGDSIPAFASRTLEQTPVGAIAVGHSMGAIIAMDMARQAPGHLSGLILACTNPGADLPERAEARLRQCEDLSLPAFRRIVVEELKPAYLGARARADASLLSLVADMAARLGPETFERQSTALRLRASLEPVLPELRLPVLVICGADDALCPPAWHRAMVARLPRASLVELPGCGHMAPLEAPDAFAAVCLSGMKIQQTTRGDVA